jgi:hypothetical protein
MHPQAPGRRDRGSTSLTTVLLTPVFVVIAFMAFQAALWTHARTEARAIARDSAAQVARSGAALADSERSAMQMLVADTDLRRPSVAIVISDGIVVAHVTGSAPGMIRGTSAAVDVTEAVPMEGFRT